MPTTAQTIRSAFGATDAPSWPASPAAQLLDRLSRGAKVTPPDVLFRKIEDADVAEWRARFGGPE